jgi:hypothetical protein
MCALREPYKGERTWKARSQTVPESRYLSRVDHESKVRSRKQRTDAGKYSFVNRAIQLWNELPADALGTLL